jgi:hypothetical protein
MWVPRDTSEIEEAVRRGDLQETPSFDAKESLPASRKKNIDLAIDVAAMSTEGGALLYGVGEDDQERLTRLEPITLAGAADRIGQIVATSISEVPYIEIGEHPTEADPTKGYVSVLVPQSPRGPHQVVVGDDKRYYGRGAKGNRRLGQVEVARLYQRRLEWQQDSDALLLEAVGQARFSSAADLGYLHGFARPVVPDHGIWDRALAAAGGRLELQDRLRQAAASAGPSAGFSPDLRGAANWRRRGGDEWLLSTQPELDPTVDVEKAAGVVDVRLNVDGRGHLFCGRAAARRLVANGAGPLAILEVVIAGNYAAFLALMGTFYELGGYHGHVDIGLSVTGIRNAVSVTGGGGLSFGGDDPYMADSYPRTRSVSAKELLSPESITRDMLRHFFEATTGREGFDPFDGG